ncbi:septum site-determining protein MinC [Fusibacter paucivorans]|nr:septum site-determining protein MinC [Fusibacter paucivorans]
MKAPVAFKGTVNGLYLAIESAVDFEILVDHLKQILEKSADFYKGSNIIGCKGQKMSYAEKYRLEEIIKSYGIGVDSLELMEETPKTTSVQLDEPKTTEKEIVVEKEVIVEKEVFIEKEVLQSDTKFVYGTMRSGKGVEFSGNVIVLGDVNPGSEIIAGGNIIVIGKLLGFVHAGAYGDDEAFVVANHMAPTQIRISRYISVPPKDENREANRLTEKASVNNGVIKIESIH